MMKVRSNGVHHHQTSKETESPSDSVASEVSESDSDDSSSGSSSSSSGSSSDDDSSSDSDDLDNSSEYLSAENGSSNGTPSSHNHKQSREVKQVQKLSEAETKSIRFWRVIVLVLLIVAGAAVASGTYVFLTKANETDFLNRVRACVLQFLFYFILSRFCFVVVNFVSKMEQANKVKRCY